MNWFLKCLSIHYLPVIEPMIILFGLLIYLKNNQFTNLDQFTWIEIFFWKFMIIILFPYSMFEWFFQMAKLQILTNLLMVMKNQFLKISPTDQKFSYLNKNRLLTNGYYLFNFVYHFPNQNLKLWYLLCRSFLIN